MDQNVKLVSYKLVSENGKLRMVCKYEYAITAAPYKLRAKYTNTAR